MTAAKSTIIGYDFEIQGVQTFNPFATVTVTYYISVEQTYTYQQIISTTQPMFSESTIETFRVKTSCFGVLQSFLHWCGLLKQ